MKVILNDTNETVDNTSTQVNSGPYETNKTVDNTSTPDNSGPYETNETVDNTSTQDNSGSYETNETEQNRTKMHTQILVKTKRPKQIQIQNKKISKI